MQYQSQDDDEDVFGKELLVAIILLGLLVVSVAIFGVHNTSTAFYFDDDAVYAEQDIEPITNIESVSSE